MSDGLWGILLTSVALLVIGGYKLCKDGWNQSTDQYFMDYGVAAKGELVQKIEDTRYYKRKGYPTSKTYGYYLRIAYQHPELGRKIAKVEVPYESYMKVFEGPPLTIRYLRDDPEQIRIVDVSSVSPKRHGWSLLMFFAGVAGTGFIGLLYLRHRFGNAE